MGLIPPAGGTSARCTATEMPVCKANPIVPLKGKAYQKPLFAASKAIVSIVKKPLCPLWLNFYVETVVPQAPQQFQVNSKCYLPRLR